MASISFTAVFKEITREDAFSIYLYNISKYLYLAHIYYKHSHIYLYTAHITTMFNTLSKPT